MVAPTLWPMHGVEHTPHGCCVQCAPRCSWSVHVLGKYGIYFMATAARMPHLLLGAYCDRGEEGVQMLAFCFNIRAQIRGNLERTSHQLISTLLAQKRNEAQTLFICPGGTGRLVRGRGMGCLQSFSRSSTPEQWAHSLR